MDDETQRLVERNNAMIREQQARVRAAAALREAAEHVDKGWYANADKKIGDANLHLRAARLAGFEAHRAVTPS